MAMNKINFYTSVTMLLVALTCIAIACRDDNGISDNVENGSELTLSTLNTRTGSESAIDFADGAKLLTYLSCEEIVPRETVLTYHAAINGKAGYWSSSPALYWLSSTRKNTLTVYQEAEALQSQSNGKRAISLTAITAESDWTKLDVVAKAVTVNATTDPLPSVTLEHCMAMVKVTVTCSTGLSLTGATVGVKMKLPTQGELNLTNGTVVRKAKDGTTADIAFYKPAVDTQEFYALALPETTGTREITITVGKDVYTYTAPKEIVFTAGACNAFALKLNLYGVELSQAMVEEWQDISAQGSPSSDILFLSASSGDLSGKLNALASGQKAIKKVAVTGKMNGSDIGALCSYIKTNNITDLTLLAEGGVVSNNSYNGCTSLKNVVLGRVITSVAHDAFKDCTSLLTISMPGVTHLFDRVFKGCTALKSADMDSLVSIGWEAFKGCIALAEVDLRNVKVLGEDAFRDCTNLATVKNTQKITTCRNAVFAGSSYAQNMKILNASNYPNLKTMDGGMGFPNLTEVDLPMLSVVGDNGFGGSSLKKVNLPAATSVGSTAFRGVVDAEITLGITDVRRLNAAWNSGAGIKTLNLPNAEGELSSIAHYQSSITTLNAPKISGMAKDLFKAYLKLVTVNAPNVTTIEDGTFNGCTNLVKLTVSKNVTSIGVEAFNGCKALTTLDMGITAQAIIGRLAFNNCTELDFYKFFNTLLTSVGDNAFSGSKLTHFLYGGTASPALGACDGCSSLKTVEMRNLETSIGHRIFNSCRNLKTAILTGNVYRFGDFTFSGAQSLDFVWGILPTSINNTSWGWQSHTFSGTTINNLFLTKITAQSDASALKTKLLKSGDSEANCKAVNNVYYNYHGPNSDNPAQASNDDLTNPQNYTKL